MKDDEGDELHQHNRDYGELNLRVERLRVEEETEEASTDHGNGEQCIPQAVDDEEDEEDAPDVLIGLTDVHHCLGVLAPEVTFPSLALFLKKLSGEVCTTSLANCVNKW